MHYSFILLCFILFATAGSNAQQTNWLGEQNVKGAFPLVSDKGDASLCYDSNEPEGVSRAIGDLRTDIHRVTGRTLRTAVGNDLTRRPVIIGTVGHSRLLDRLAANGKLSLDSLKGKWESSVVTVIDAPLPGVEIGRASCRERV